MITIPLSREAVNEPIEIIAKYYWAEYEGGWDDIHAYEIKLTDTYNILEEKYDNEESNSNFYHIAICTNEEPVTGVLPNGTYVLSTTPEAGTLSGVGGGECYIIRNGEWEEVYATDAVLVISDNKIDGTFTLENGEVHHVVYEGSLKLYKEGEEEDTTTPPANEIWYTSTDGEVVAPSNADELGVNIISNTYENGKGVITFDGDVTSIGHSAFSYCSSLASITIPDSVTEIGGWAFDYCTSLTSITIPDSVTSIETSVFWGCSSLTSVTIPDSVTSIEYGIFSGCSSLKSIYGKYTSEDGRCLIVDGVLNSFAPAGLTEYTIPDSVTMIGHYAFYYCSSLTSITIPESVTEIWDRAFDSCSSLTSVTIPDSVTSIGEAAFRGCTSLKSIYGKYASEDSRCLIIGGTLNSFAPAGLTDYTIPDSVTSIGDYAFYNCTSLTSITVPASVTSIGWYAFLACTSLESVYCKATTPPAGGSDMFHNNAWWGRKIYVPTESVDAYKGADYWSDYADAFVPYDFEKGEVDIKYRKICYTSTDGEVVTPYNAYAFGANIVSNTYEDGKGVIVFDGVVTSIGDQAFSERSSLASVTIPDSVTEIGDYAFCLCSSLASVTIPDSVTSIGEGAFYYCTSLASVTIGNGVTEIGMGAFNGCSSLTSFYGKYASEDGRCLIIDGTLNFFAPAGLTEYTIPDSVTSIGTQAFSYCTSLTSVTIPDSVTSIGKAAFLACLQLESVTIGSGVTSIGTQAFSYCESLTSFYGKYASEDGRCLIVDGTLNSFAPAGLTEYTIPDSVTSIGEAAFFGCWQLESVTIGSGVTSIGYSAFAVCDNLAFVHCKSTTPPTMQHSSNYTPTFTSYLLNIYVPEGCVDAYKSADGWSDYADAIRTYAPNNYANWLGTYTLSGKGNAYDSESDSWVERDVEFTISVEAKDESTMTYYVTGWDGCSYPIEAQYNSENELILSAGVIAEGVDRGDSGVGDFYFVGCIGDGYIRVVGPIIKLSKDSNQAVGLTVDGNEVTGAAICLYQDGSFYFLRSYGDVYTPLDMEVGGSASYAPMKVGARGGRYFEVDRTRKLNIIK